VKYKTIIYNNPIQEVGEIIFNRPQVKNAFNEELLEEIISLTQEIKNDPKIKVVILTGVGDVFCAGADINWVKRCKERNKEENYQSFLKLSNALYSIYSLPKPVVGKINGHAIGGGVGFVAVCDIGVGVYGAKFGFSEVKIGLVPACISPYIIRKCREDKVRELFITGRRIREKEAKEVGLIHEIVEKEELNKRIEEIIEELLTGSCYAISMCKKLLEEVRGMSLSEATTYTAKMLSELVPTEETQEGISAFLEKRKPKWRKGE